jgi:hypothetical protein
MATWKAINSLRSTRNPSIQARIIKPLGRNGAT